MKSFAMTESVLSRFKIETVLMDVDGTITAAAAGGTHDSGGEGGATGYFGVLAQIVSEIHAIPLCEAARKIKAAGNIETTCLFSLLPALKVPLALYWDRMVAEFKKNIVISEDARVFIKALPVRGVRLYAVTTNSRMGALTKLAVGGLATLEEGCPYFSGFFGGDTFGDPQGKFSPDFYPAIIKQGVFDPKKTLMIGDDYVHDIKRSLEAGIGHAVMIDRSRVEPISREQGELCVNSLQWVLEMIEPGNAAGKPGRPPATTRKSHTQVGTPWYGTRNPRRGGHDESIGRMCPL